MVAGSNPAHANKTNDVYYYPIHNRKYISRKKVFKIIKVSKKEMEFLQSKGIKFRENGLSVTHSKHSGKTYYLTATQRNMELINNYRKSIICK